jgi:predicted  nucleic acid-binding Zn-ribbon protein
MKQNQCNNCGTEFYGEDEALLCPKCVAKKKNLPIERKAMWNHHYQPPTKEAEREVYEEFNIMD